MKCIESHKPRLKVGAGAETRMKVKACWACKNEKDLLGCATADMRRSVAKRHVFSTERHPAATTTTRTAISRGTWCSGITSASHAEGPGFKSQCVHFSSWIRFPFGLTPHISVWVICLNQAHASFTGAKILEAGLEPAISSLGGRRLIH